jgi:hypothetical protein
VTIAPVSLPSVSIAAPASGGVYSPGASVATSFSCSEGAGGLGLESCTDSNGSSAPSGHLDSSTPGPHTYTATARSKDGLVASASLTYTVTSGAAPPPTTARVVGRPRVNGASVTIQLACSGAPGTTCAVSLLASSTEHLSANGSLVAVSAKAHHKRRRSRTAVVTVAQKSYTVAAGKTEKITLTLTAFGKTLLKRFGKLPAKLTVGQNTNGKSTTVSSTKITFTSPHRPPRKHHKRR